MPHQHIIQLFGLRQRKVCDSVLRLIASRCRYYSTYSKKIIILQWNYISQRHCRRYGYQQWHTKPRAAARPLGLCAIHIPRVSNKKYFSLCKLTYSYTLQQSYVDAVAKTPPALDKTLETSTSFFTMLQFGKNKELKVPFTLRNCLTFSNINMKTEYERSNFSNTNR